MLHVLPWLFMCKAAFKGFAAQNTAYKLPLKKNHAKSWKKNVRWAADFYNDFTVDV